MPKGLKRALAAARKAGSSDVDDEDDLMMELEAAKKLMEEQEFARANETPKTKQHAFNKTGLLQMIDQIATDLPWAETLAIRSIPVQLEDVHDDLQRELVFYNASVAAVNLAKEKLDAENVPYKRPVDYFCEMIKTDNHMDKIKDKLIFEEKKMDAFQQRKARSEQRKFSKEVVAEKLKEKSTRKKEMLNSVSQWRKDSKVKGTKVLVPDDDGLDDYLSGNKRPREEFKKGKTRVARDKKFGFGGVPGRLKKANTKKSINDFSTFNEGSRQKGKQGRPNKGSTRLGKSKRQNKSRGKK